ncbi:AraC family transcriptional regulator [Paenibacillus sp. GYB003]|uniref:AraC family transcriptional regulator n=1 Tax=Paenibacillus sp. GYB003 TaxID=2994392 RepID=UPI002F965545
MNHPLETVTFHSGNSYGKRICAPGWHWDHRTPFRDYDLFYVASGRGAMTLGGETFELQKRCCVVMRPGDMPKASQDPKNRLTVLFLHFRLSGADEAAGPFPFPRYTLIGESFQAETMLNQMMELLAFPVPLQQLEFDCMMKRFFANLYRVHLAPDQPGGASVRQMQKARRLMAAIRERGGIGLDLHALAREMSMSPQYMSRLFKASTGETLKSFIARTKMQRAGELLVQSRMRISELAERMGYSDVYAFSKSFKNVFGVAPSQYLAGVRLPAPSPPPDPR